MNWLAKYLINRTLKQEASKMDFLKGKKTIIVNVLSFATLLFGWDQIGQFVSPKVVAEAITVINLILRFVTTTPVFDAGTGSDTTK